MKTVGIIVEYNPLHYGHVYHFQQSKKVAEADAVIAVMSGNFLQRGEPALLNKWARTEMALRMGVDVVIELPVAFSSQPAEWFAYGAVSVLEATGVVDSLCFGSESGEIEWLQRLAHTLQDEPAAFRQALKAYLKKGMSFPAAYSAAAHIYTEHGEVTAAGIEYKESLLAQPNNSLGLHYLISLKRLKSAIRPLTITRQKAGYSQKDITDSHIASATAIRHLLFERNSLADAAPYLPPYTYEVLNREWMEGRAPIDWESFALPLLHQLISRTAEELAEIYEVNEGLEHRIKRILPILFARPAFTVDEMTNLLKTRRYTRTKLQRTLLRILLNHSKSMLNEATLSKGSPYLRILGFSERGRELLKKMKKTATVPIVTKVTKETSPFLQLDIQTTSVHALAYKNPTSKDVFRDYYEPPIQV